MATIAQNLAALQQARTDIAEAIENKGVTLEEGAGFTDFPQAIEDIPTGVDTSNDTVTAATLKSGYTAHNAAGQKITGTLLSQSTTVTASTLKSGYTAYNKAGTRITGTLLSQSTTVTASTLKSGYTAYNQAGTRITGTLLSQSTTATADDIDIGKTAYDNNGNLLTGTKESIESIKFLEPDGTLYLPSGSGYVKLSDFEDITKYQNTHFETVVRSASKNLNRLGIDSNSFSGTTIDTLYMGNDPSTSYSGTKYYGNKNSDYYGGVANECYAPCIVTPFGTTLILSKQYWESSLYSSYYGLYMDDSLKTIESQGFQGCTGLRKIRWSKNLTTIGDAAFYEPYYITKIDLPPKVQSIGSSFAFKALQELSIPASIETIKSSAFYYNTNLTTITINKPSGSISGAPWGATNATVVWTG